MIQVPLNGQNYQQQKGPGNSNLSLFRLRNKFRKIISIIFMYWLTKFDYVIQNGFWVIPKTISANVSKPIHDIINNSTSICLFESGKCGKEGKKLQKFKYVENKKSFFNEIKTKNEIFYSFLKDYHLAEKRFDKNLIKNSGHKL